MWVKNCYNKLTAFDSIKSYMVILTTLIIKAMWVAFAYKSKLRVINDIKLGPIVSSIIL